MKKILLALCLFVASFSALAALTPAQQATLKADILADPILSEKPQFNVQTILTGRESINPSKANIRAGLQDALTGLPSGASGANKNGGWANVNAVLYRKTNRIEKLLATGSGTTVSPSLLGYEGSISYQDVELARNSQ